MVLYHKTTKGIYIYILRFKSSQVIIRLGLTIITVQIQQQNLSKHQTICYMIYMNEEGPKKSELTAKV